MEMVIAEVYYSVDQFCLSITAAILIATLQGKFIPIAVLWLCKNVLYLPCFHIAIFTKT